MNYLKLFILIGMIFLLSACEVIVPSNINEISMVQGIGFDRTNEGDMRGTIIHPKYGIDEISGIEVLKAEGQTIRKVMDHTRNKVQYPLVLGQLRIAVFGKKLADEGIFPVLDTINRSPTIGSLLQLAVAEGDASELLSIKGYEKENIALYLPEMIQQNIKTGEMPTTDFMSFMYKFYDDGNDPYLPLLKKEKDKIKINGLAFFHNDSLKFSLPMKDVFTFKIIEEKFKMGARQFKVGENEYLVISNIKSSPHYKVKNKNGIPEFDIHVKMNARIQEFSSRKQINVAKKILSFQKKAEVKIEKDAEKLITVFQDNRIDPLALGAKYEAHNRNFDRKKWEEQYPHVKVNVDVDLTIAHSGIVE